jgi:hypothetical protein
MSKRSAFSNRAGFDRLREIQYSPRMDAVSERRFAFTSITGMVRPEARGG